jgi:hypothetical protein
MGEFQIDSEIVAALELARDQIAALIDAGSGCIVGAADGLPELGPHCGHCGSGVPDAAIKDAIRPFVEAWALFPFDAALAAIHGRESVGERSYLGAVARGVAAGPAHAMSAGRERAVAAA